MTGGNHLFLAVIGDEEYKEVNEEAIVLSKLGPCSSYKGVYWAPLFLWH